MGQLIFTVSVIFINTKLFILDMHNKTLVPLIGWLLMIGAWFLWNLIMATTTAIHANDQIQYPVHLGFTQRYGRDLLWWLTGAITLAVLIVFELSITALTRVYFPTDQSLWQEIEHLGQAGKVLEEHATTTDVERGEIPHENSDVAVPAGRGVELGRIDSGGTFESR